MATTTFSGITATTSPSPTSTSTNGTNSNDSGGGKPLLFFVALGFGVVFTNLWIIVGVKYCFRYNRRRNGQLQIDHETGEPIDLANMPRPRRRREKKLMSMEEVNERFPLTKYKSWRASRESKGLPAAGGVTAPPSRAASIKETMLERMSTEVEESSFAEPASPRRPHIDSSSDSRDFAQTSTPEITSAHSPPVVLDGTNEKKGVAAVTEKETDPNAVTPGTIDDDDNDPIGNATVGDNNELLQAPGDACAICIDNLDDDDEVRGLTCGHAFHAGCLDPWLTNRRACCPLCKADYYVPKPRANADAAAANNAEGGAGGPDDAQPPAWPALSRGGLARGQRVVFAGSRFHVDQHERYGFPILVRDRPMPHHTPHERRAQMGRNADGTLNHVTGDEDDEDATPTATHAPEVQSGNPTGPASTTLGGRMWRGMTSRMRTSRHTTDGTAAPSQPSQGEAPSTTTPSELEAGVVTVR